MSFFEELKRRNIFKVDIAYAIVAWLLLQVSDTLVPALHLPEWFNSGVAFLPAITIRTNGAVHFVNGPVLAGTVYSKSSNY